MDSLFLLINWNPDPDILTEPIRMRWYGLLFASGFIVGYYITRKIFRAEGVKDDMLDKLLLYVMIGGVLGARLGHVFFYGPYYDEFNAAGELVKKGYLDHPEDIIKIWEGGLASHGGAIGILITLILYTRFVSKGSLLWVLDRSVVAIALAGCFIRLGNLMNSEIVGVVTDVPWAFHFEQFRHAVTGAPDPEGVGRHPAQLYEAIAYFLIFVVLMRLYWKRKMGEYRGFLFGAFLFLIFTARLLIEFLKAGQTDRDAEYLLNTGQMLSIPLILVGAVFLYLSRRKGRNPEPGVYEGGLVKADAQDKKS